MPAIILTAKSSLQMVQFCKDEQPVFYIIMKAFDHQLFLLWKIMHRAETNQVIYLFQAFPAKAIIAGVVQKALAFFRNRDRGTLAIGNILYPAFKF